MTKPKDIQEPLNVTEQYLYGINVRLEVLIEMMSSFIQAYADKEGIATEKNVTKNPVQEKPKPKSKPKAKKGTKKDGA